MTLDLHTTRTDAARIIAAASRVEFDLRRAIEHTRELLRVLVHVAGASADPLGWLPLLHRITEAGAQVAESQAVMARLAMAQIVGRRTKPKSTHTPRKRRKPLRTKTRR